jgi:hypothetical protein
MAAANWLRLCGDYALTATMRKTMAAGRMLLVAALFAPALLAQDASPSPPIVAAPVAAPHHKSHKQQKPLVLPPMPGGPLSQLPMDQIPAAPAKVSFQGGLLSISAENSTLGEILRDVRQLTGAAIEIPAGSAANERVVTSLGPGAPRDVLAGLLNGSSFDYVMLGSSTDPTAVSSVILTNKSPSTGEATQTAAVVPYQSNPDPVASHPWPPGRPMPVGPGFNRAQGAAQPGQAAQAEDDSKDDDQDAADDSDDPAQPAQPDANGAGANPNAAQDQSQPTDPNQPNAGPKTPEQILEMLRRQQPPGGPIAAPQQPPPQ